MNTTVTTVTATAHLRLRVPRGAGGDLPSGIVSVLENVGGVHDAAIEDVERVRPTSTDIRVDVAARLALEAAGPEPRPAAVRERLADGFGVVAVEAVALDADHATA